MSDLMSKTNEIGKVQTRVIVLTTLAIYNIRDKQAFMKSFKNGVK